VGGGFPGNTTDGLQFAEIAQALGPAIDHLFPKSVRVISEPGRYFVSSAFTLAVNIMARRVVSRDGTQPTRAEQQDLKTNLVAGSDSTISSHADEHPSFMYYVNDGMYGSFNCITFDHAIVKARALSRGGEFCHEVALPSSVPLFPCSVWGPTCDSIDCIGRDLLLPEMQVGDWLYFSQMGAYTMAAASPL
jgi:ornithine decarboxylase